MSESRDQLVEVILAIRNELYWIFNPSGLPGFCWLFLVCLPRTIIQLADVYFRNSSFRCILRQDRTVDMSTVTWAIKSLPLSSIKLGEFFVIP